MIKILEGNFTIFLVDDQRISNFVNKKLIEVADICNNVHDFVNPLEALECLEERQPDLIFLDLNMPQIDGWTFLDRMGKLKISSKVVIVTSSTSSVDRKKAKTYPQIIDYYTKPLNKLMIKELRERFTCK